jgi:DNA-directed RNA polymerase sigma subunit (sigma70/sigma32)
MIAYIGNRHPSFLKPDAVKCHRVDPNGSSGDQDRPNQDALFPFAVRSERDITGSESVTTCLASGETSDPVEKEQDRQEDETNIAGIYLKEMNRVPLLTRQKEIDLARRIQRGEKKVRRLVQNSVLRVEALRPLRRTAGRKSLDGHSSIEMARRIIRKLSRMDPSSHEGLKHSPNLIHEMKEAIASLESAKAEMVQANLRLVVSIAKIYINRGLSFLDLVLVGSLRLMKAMTR